jgi:hypothetical protein
MKVPSRAFTLSNGFELHPKEVTLGVWQDHVVRHPLGIYRMAIGRAWNDEGWDRMDPPVVSEEQRDQFIAQVPGFSVGARGCGVPAFLLGAANAAPKAKATSKAPVSPPERPCETCQPPVVTRCANALHGLGVGPRYGRIIDELAEAVAGEAGVVVPRAEVAKAVTRLWSQPARYDGLVVASLGELLKGNTKRDVLRISRADGVRAEYYANGARGAWRTTYRGIPAGASGAQRASFVLDVPVSSPRLHPSSDAYVVPRPWWQEHGC